MGLKTSDISGTSPGVALITGGSRGIGLALARQFAAKGHGLVLVARDAVALADAARQLVATFGGSVRTEALDVSDRAAVQSLAGRLKREGVVVRYLVNNAALWSEATLEHATTEELFGLVTANVTAVLDLTKTFLPEIRRAGGGGILNVGSLAGLIPTPGFACYGATKAFVGSLSGALHHELSGSGINVCLLMPGSVDTNFVPRVRATLLQRMMRSSPETVAYAGYRGLMSGQRVVVPGLLSLTMRLGIGVLPNSITSRLTWHHLGSSPAKSTA